MAVDVPDLSSGMGLKSSARKWCSFQAEAKGYALCLVIVRSSAGCGPGVSGGALRRLDRRQEEVEKGLAKAHIHLAHTSGCCGFSPRNRPDLFLSKYNPDSFLL